MFWRGNIAYEWCGKEYSTEFTSSQHTPSCSVELTEEDGVKLVVIPKGEITLRSVTLSCSLEYREEDRIFLNGYQSWTACKEQGVRGKDLRIHMPKFLYAPFALDRYGDAAFYPPKKKKGEMHGYSYGYRRRGNEFFLFYSLSEQTGYTIFSTDCKHGLLRMEKDCMGKTIDAPFTAFQVRFAEGTERSVFDAYFRALALPPLRETVKTGYTSWYNRYQNISEESIRRDLEGMKSLPEKIDFFQVDDGYESAVGDWMLVDPIKFPHGMESIAKEIQVAGFTPGIWIAPFLCEKKSMVFQEHPEWLLRDYNDNPVRCGGGLGGFYALDFYYEPVRNYIKHSLQTLLAWGYRLLKLDFLYAVAMFPQRNKTRAEVLYEALDFLREVCGDAILLGCGVPLAPAFGKLDFCRVGPDMTFDWDGKWFTRLAHPERPSTKQTLQNTFFRRQLSGRAWQNDPDVFLLRNDNTSFTQKQKESLATVNGLFGGLLFVSDDCGQYDGRTRQLLHKIYRLPQAELLDFTASDREITLEYRLDGEIYALSVSLF